MGKERIKTDGSKRDEWIKCESKSRPGRSYMFNKSTGETKWCGSEKAATGSENAKGSKRTEAARMPPPSPTIAVAGKLSKTPAQDRLKRLQSKLKKDTKVLTETLAKNVYKEKEKKNRNSNNSGSSSSGKLGKNLKQKTAHEKRVSFKQTNEAVATTSKQLKATATHSAENAAKQPPLPTQTATTAAAATTKPSTKITAKKRAASPAVATSVTKKLAKLAAPDVELTANPSNEKPASVFTNGLSFGNGIVSKIKDICKKTFKIHSESSIAQVTPKSCTSISKIAASTPELNKKTSSKDQQLQHATIVVSSSSSSSSSTATSSASSSVLCTSPNIEMMRLFQHSLCSTPKLSVSQAYQRGSANSRLERLRQSLQLQSAACSAANTPNTSAVTMEDAPMDDSVYKSANNTLNEVKPMDWESIDEAEQEEVNNVANHQSHSSTASNDSTVGEYYDAVNENLHRMAAEQHNCSTNISRRWYKDYYYFVLDTNVLLQNLTFIDDLTKMQLCDTKGTILYVPYIVLQELDKLKIRSHSESVKTYTSRAIKYLNAKFEQRDTCIQAQSANDERERHIKITSPDDSILNCCLQVKQHVENVLLLTEDINLRSKAVCNNILVSTKSDLIAKKMPAPK